MPSKWHEEGGDKKPARQYSSPQSKWIIICQDTGYINATPATREQFNSQRYLLCIRWYGTRKVIIPDPPARKFPPSRLTMEDTRKFCGYHSEATYHINNCVKLKRAVEGLMREQKLQQYVSKQRHIWAIIWSMREGTRSIREAIRQRSNAWRSGKAEKYSYSRVAKTGQYPLSEVKYVHQRGIRSDQAVSRRPVPS